MFINPTPPPVANEKRKLPDVTYPATSLDGGTSKMEGVFRSILTRLSGFRFLFFFAAFVASFLLKTIHS